MTTPPLRQLLTRIALVGACMCLLGYGVFEGRRLIEGPQISIESPLNGSAVGGPSINIAGVAKNAAFLYIDGKQAYVDQNDRFDERVSPPTGYTVVTVSARDRFGRSTTKQVHITINNFCSAHA
jgi:hypothetical protein